jgi:hypothetical protein
LPIYVHDVYVQRVERNAKGRAANEENSSWPNATGPICQTEPDRLAPCIFIAFTMSRGARTRPRAEPASVFFLFFQAANEIRPVAHRSAVLHCAKMRLRPFVDNFIAAAVNPAN